MANVNEEEEGIPERLLPDLDDPGWKPFWIAAKERRLVAQRCLACGVLRFPPLPICDRCLSEETAWVDVAQVGRVWSYAVYHRAFHPSLQAEIPYTVGIVQNDDALQFVGRIAGPRSLIAVDAVVRADFVEISAECTIVTWRPEPHLSIPREVGG